MAINSIDQITKLVKRRVGAAESKPGAVRINPDLRGPRSGSEQAQTLDELRAQIGGYVAAAAGAVNDDQRRKATRAIVERIISWQFGANFLNDALAEEIIGGVAHALEDDPALLASVIAEQGR